MKLSVVIPTKDRHESLSRLLASLASQSYKPQQIVIVTGSSDKQDIVEVISQYEVPPVAVPLPMLDPEPLLLPPSWVH